MNNKKYCIVYRTGGTENFKWHHTLESLTMTEAIISKQKIEKMGYKSYIYNWNDLLTIGMPETY